MKGWQAPENPLLGIFRVDNPGSPYHQTLPAPRVLQNQIDSRIEAHVARVELQLLKELQKAMKQKTCAWTEIFSTVFLILRVTEKDIWRLMYWLKHDKEVSTVFLPVFLLPTTYRCYWEICRRISGNTPKALASSCKGVCSAPICFWPTYTARAASRMVSGPPSHVSTRSS